MIWGQVASSCKTRTPMSCLTENELTLNLLEAQGHFYTYNSL